MEQTTVGSAGRHRLSGVRAAASWLSLHRGLLAAALCYLVFDVSFNVYELPSGDAQIPFTFLRRLFGEDVHAVGYQFGLAFMETPFYGLGKLLSGVGVSDLYGNPIGPALIAVGNSVYVLGAAVIMAAVLTSLRLPASGFVLLASVFGTPLIFYGVLFPGQTHAADAFLVTAAVGLLFVYFKRPSPPLPIVIGLLLGLAVTVRYFNAAEAVALTAGLVWLGRSRDAGLVASATAVSFGLLLLVPVSLDAPLFTGTYSAESLGWAPLSPFKMLFTDHRGLFVWTPVTVLALIGFVRLLWRRERERPFLALVGLMGLALVLSYSTVPFWDAGFSFSQRYFTPLFPLVVLGLAGLVDWRPKLAVPAASIATLWSLFLAFNLALGFHGGEFAFSERRDGASDLAVRMVRGDVSAHDFAAGIYRASHLKRLVWFVDDGHSARRRATSRIFDVLKTFPSTRSSAVKNASGSGF